MSPDYLSACTQQMSLQKKGPQVLLACIGNTGVMAEVTSGISQR